MDVTIEFRHRLPAASPVQPQALVNPTAPDGSFVQFITDTSPGGPTTIQATITILVFGLFLMKTPASPLGVMTATIVLIMTPWIMVLFGFGSTIAAVIVLVNVATGSFAYKALMGRTE